MEITYKTHEWECIVEGIPTDDFVSVKHMFKSNIFVSVEGQSLFMCCLIVSENLRKWETHLVLCDDSRFNINSATWTRVGNCNEWEFEDHQEAQDECMEECDKIIKEVINRKKEEIIKNASKQKTMQRF